MEACRSPDADVADGPSGSVTGPTWTAAQVLAVLSPGMRMKDLFDAAKAASTSMTDELEKLFAESPTRPGWRRSASSTSRPGSGSATSVLRDTYLRHHDRIDAWDMVDRAAPGWSARPWSAGRTTCSTSSPRPPTRCADGPR